MALAKKSPGTSTTPGDKTLGFMLDKELPPVPGTLHLVLCPRSELMGSKDCHLLHYSSSWSLQTSAKTITQWIANGDSELRRGRKEKNKKVLKREKKAKLGTLTDTDKNRNNKKVPAVKNSSNRDLYIQCRPHAVSPLKDVTALISFATVIFLQERRA